MRRVDHDDAYTAAQERHVAGPLFDSGPFDHSPIGEARTKFEDIVARRIFAHRGRSNPISIEMLREAAGLSERAVKGVVFNLRTEFHMPIGALRGSGNAEAVGYFWIVDAEDREIALAPYRGQILTMWRTLRVLESPEKLRELRAEMTVEGPE